MSATVRCIIVGCPSGSVKDLKLQFYRFPLPDSPQYNALLDIFYSSADEIRKHSRPYICSKHFIITEDIDGRRFTVPKSNSINLPDSDEKERLTKLLNEIVCEWCSRVHNTSQSTCILAHVAMTVRKLLGPVLCQLTIDESWCQNFRLNYLNPFPTRKFGKSVNLKDIVKELDPHVKLYTKHFSKAALNWDNFIQLSVNLKDVIKELNPHAKMDTKQFDEAVLKTDTYDKVTEVTNKTYDSKSRDKSCVSEIKAYKPKKPPSKYLRQFNSPSHSISETNISSNHTDAKCEPIVMQSEGIDIDNYKRDIVDTSSAIIVGDKYDPTGIGSANKITESMPQGSSIKIKTKDDIIFQPNVNTYAFADSCIEDLFLKQPVKKVALKTIHRHEVGRTESKESQNKEYSYFELMMQGNSIKIKASDKKVHPNDIVYEFSDCDVKNEFLKQSVKKVPDNTTVSTSLDGVNRDNSDKPNRDYCYVDSVIQSNCHSNFSINIEAKDENNDGRSVTKVVGNTAVRHKSPDKYNRDDSRDNQNRDYCYVDAMIPEYSYSNMNTESQAKDENKNGRSVRHQSVDEVICYENSDNQNGDYQDNVDSMIQGNSHSSLSSEIEAEQDNEPQSNVNVYEFSDSDMESEIFEQSFRKTAVKARVQPICKSPAGGYGTRKPDEKIGTEKNYLDNYLSYVNEYRETQIFLFKRFDFSKLEKRRRQELHEERQLSTSKSQAEQMESRRRNAFLTGLECDNDPLLKHQTYVLVGRDQLKSKPKIEVKTANYNNDTGQRSIRTNFRQSNNSDSMIVNGIDEDATIDTHPMDFQDYTSDVL